MAIPNAVAGVGSRPQEQVAATVDANGRPLPAPTFDQWKYADPTTVLNGAPAWAHDFLGGSLNNYWGVRAPDGPGKQQTAGQMFLPENANYQLSYANGPHMMFPSMGPASSGFFKNMGAQVPAQANAKDWYAKVDTAKPNWWDKSSGSTTFEYHPQSKDMGFGQFLTSALGMGASALLGLPPSPAGTLLGAASDVGSSGSSGKSVPLLPSPLPATPPVATPATTPPLGGVPTGQPQLGALLAAKPTTRLQPQSPDFDVGRALISSATTPFSR